MADDSDDVKRDTVKIVLTPKARETIENVREDTGVPKTEAVARLIEWFASFDRKARIAILNGDDEARAELAWMTLREMAGIQSSGVDPTKAPLTAEEAARVARNMIVHMLDIKGPGSTSKKKG